MKTDADIGRKPPAEMSTAERFDAFVEATTRFHGYPAPGVLIGCYMVEAAQRRLPAETLYDALCETAWCLPDAVQMLTPCTIGNGWLRILDYGLFALSLYDKYTGEGVRVYLDPAKLRQWADVADWFLKRKSKPEQNSRRVREQIRAAADRMVSVAPVTVRAEFLIKRSKGPIRLCPACHEAYPQQHGDVCRRCQGDSPYRARPRETVGRGTDPRGKGRVTGSTDDNL
ncbi:MAG: formylmethanofuran dehydrogenase subunit E family protein [Desulfobacterales bacterium]